MSRAAMARISRSSSTTSTSGRRTSSGDGLGGRADSSRELRTFRSHSGSGAVVQNFRLYSVSARQKQRPQPGQTSVRSLTIQVHQLAERASYEELQEWHSTRYE